MVTTKEFIERCACLINEKKNFVSYWYPSGTGIIFRREDRRGSKFKKLVDNLWENPDVYPMYIVTSLNGEFSFEEKSPVSDMLYDLVETNRSLSSERG